MLHCNSKTLRSIIGAAALCIAGGSQGASITPLDFYADLISGDGNVVAGHTRGDLGPFGSGAQLTVYQNGQRTVVSQVSRPIDISTHGTILAGDIPSSSGLTRIGSHIYADGELTSLFSNPLVESPEAFFPWGISPDGNTLVGEFIPNTQNFPFSVQAATYSNGQVQIVGPEDSRGRDIAANGAVVGSQSRGEIGLFTEEGFSEISFEQSDLFAGQAFDISKDGSTAVGYHFMASSTLLGLYAYRDGVASPLANSESISRFPVDIFYRSIGISGDGSTIVSHNFQNDDETVSYLWELNEDGNYIATSLIDKLLILGLDISAQGWSNLQANNISDDGRFIVGWGTQSGNPDTVGFIIDLHPVPLPTSAWLFASAFIGLAAFKKYGRR